MTEWSVSHEMKKSHGHKEGGWLASLVEVVVSIVISKKIYIVAKDVVGLLLGEVVSMKKKHIIATDVVGLLVGDSENNREVD